MILSAKFMIVILIICIVLVTETKIQKNDEKVEKFIKDGVNEFKIINYKCLSLEVAYLLWLKKSKSSDIVLFCIYSSLKNSKVTKIQRQYMWAVLSDICRSNKETMKSKFAFKQLNNKNVVFMKNDWYFLGPFQIGKPEIDGNPIDALGNDYLTDNRWNQKVKAYSELLKSAIVKWTTVHSDVNGMITVSPQVDWNDLVMSLQSMAVTEWQGLLINEFIVIEGEVEVQCLGVNMFYVDDILMNGDIYHRQKYWYPLSLASGVHVIKVPIRTKGQIGVKCMVKVNNKKELIFHQASFIPDLVDQNLFSPYIAIVVTNMNMAKVANIKNVIIKKHNLDLELTVQMQEEVHIQPGQIGSIKLKLHSENQKIHSRCRQESYTMTLKFQTNLNSKEFNVQIRCRNSDQSFLFTFLDHDNSIQHAAVVKPLTSCLLDMCPVLLSLHGTGVTAQNQADSYKRKKGNSFMFGVEKLWLLAPTRHGAHNWEGPGELTSMTALTTLGDLTRNAPWLAKPANVDVVVFAGHSMGGHGAWQLSIHRPDKALAIISAAGWLSKEHYGDSNLFYHHDVSVSHTDPMIKCIQESCIVENQADKHASNLKGIPVMIRIGSNDRTVHPYFPRRMYRLLKENHVNVTYNEIPGKEHWWWDTKTENDGGVTNDLKIRTFAIYAVEQYEERKQQQSVCNENGCSGVDDKSKYYKKQDQRDEGTFTYVVYNPASFEGGRGVKVIQQKIPFRKSQYDINITKSIVEILTTNIQCFVIYEPIIHPIRWPTKSIIIDGQHIEKQNGNLPWRFCFNDKTWTIINDDNMKSDERFSKSYGPARRIAEQPFSILICDNGNKFETGILQNAAIFLSNLFHLTSDAHTNIVVTNKLVQHTEKNVILMGTDNCVSSMTKKKLVTFLEDSVKIGDCLLTGRNLSALYLQPHGNDNLMLLLTGHTVQSIRDNVMKLSIPTIPPMTRSPFSNLIPDYVILSPDVLSKGPGGFLCTGFWNNSWNYDVSTSSCSCF